MTAPSGQTETLVQEDVPGPPLVEEEVAEPPPPPRGRPPLLWPWLLLLLLLVAAGLIALWLVKRGDHKASATVVVPNVIGQKQGAAVQRLDRAGLSSRVIAKPSKAPAGTVFAEEPGPGSRVTRGSVVSVSISSAAVVNVPDVVGDKAPAAVRSLRQAGLSVQTATVASTKPAGVVLAQSPAAGASVSKGSTVVIRVSRGAVRVPTVLGQTRSAAVSVLRAAGLVPAVFTVPSAQPKGTVLAQRPHGGTRVTQGSKVRLNVSNGSSSGIAPPPPPPPPASKSVPDVTSQPQEAAQRQLNTAGFKSRVVYVPSDQPQGTVVSQSPSGGTTAKQGTRITLNASLGPNAGAGAIVPKVLGLDPQTATSRLESAGFQVQRLTQTTTVRSRSGKVVDVQPAAGVRAPAGSTVTIYVGRFSS